MTNKSKAAAVRINSATKLISLPRESINSGVYHTGTGYPVLVQRGMTGAGTVFRSFPSVEVLELEPHLERALSRRLERASAHVVDEPKSARELTIRASGFGRTDIGASWVLHLRAIENVLEVHPHCERHSLVLAELEDPPQAHGFRRPPLITVVVIVWRTRAKLPVRRVRPRVRVQHQVLCRIDAVAVQIL